MSIRNLVVVSKSKATSKGIYTMKERNDFYSLLEMRQIKSPYVATINTYVWEMKEEADTAQYGMMYQPL